MKKLLLLIPAVLFLTACTSVENFNIKKAIVACQDHEGLRQIVITPLFLGVECNNGKKWRIEQ